MEVMGALAKGWANEPTTLALLQDRLTNDKDAQVRIEAMGALATGWTNEPTTLALVRDCIMNDGEPRVRCAAIARLIGDFALLGPYVCFARTRKYVEFYPSEFYPSGFYPSEFYPSEFYFHEIVSRLHIHMPLFQDIVDLFPFRWHAFSMPYREFWRFQEYRFLGDSETVPFLLDRATVDGDRTVRATAITYAALLAPKDSRLDSFLEARQKEESDKSLRGYISELADFVKKPATREPKNYD
jgi:hypothetical protein